MLHRKGAARFEMDMTRGAILPKVLRFSLPLMASGILQLLYNAADIIVVGRFAGAQSLAAVGSTSSLINLLVNLFIGISLGASVITARDYGAGDVEAVQRDVHSAVTLGLLSGFGVGIAGFFLSRPLLEAMGSPEDVIDLAALYVRIYFLGMPFNLLYNFGAALLRAVGDTRRPLIYLTVSGLVNLALNLLLVIVFHMDVAGVAIATIASQAVSMALVMITLVRSDTLIRLNLRGLTLHGRTVRRILGVGLPAGLQSSLFSFSNVLIQSSINSFGSLVMAGSAASSSVEGFVYTSMNALAQADMTFASQNMGAGQNSRVRRTLWICLGTVVAVGLSVGGIVLLLGPTLLGLYNTDPQVIAFGMDRLRIIVSTYFLCGMMDVLACHMRGVGYSVLPMVVSLSGACLFRIVWIWTFFAASPSPENLYISYPISWALTAFIHMLTWLIARKKLMGPDRLREENA